MNVGIIGTGIIAREHATAIAAIPESAVLVAAADVSHDRLAEFANGHNVTRCYASASELIADDDVELVAVATPPSFHEELVVAALEAGKFVLCEKPLAQSLASAKRIAAAEARYPGRLSVSYQLRYTPQIRRMLWLIQNGWIGEVDSATVERHSYIPHANVGPKGWWGAWDIAGGGVLITQLIHELDIMLMAMGEPRSVSAEMDTRNTRIQSEDWIEAIVRFDGGRMAKCVASVNSGTMRGGLTIEGTLGRISPVRLSLKNPDREKAALAAVDHALPETKAASMSFHSRALRKIGRKLGAVPTPELSGHAMLYRDIAARISKGAPLPISSAEALKSLQLCAGAYESAISAREVRLPLDPGAGSYAGVTKASYDTRTRSRRSVPPLTPRIARSNVVRVGLIGLDTTHATTFTDLLHNPYNPEHIPGSRVVGAYPGGSPDMPISASRVGSFTADLRDKFDVPILDSPEAVADAADVVFILSCDGRVHPGLFRSIAGRGTPVFIDKPLAISCADAEQIYATAQETGTKLFASSAFRYADGLVAAINDIRNSGETITGCRVHYWGQIQPTQGRFFWYGIHGAEMLLAVMGRGVRSVEARTQGNKDVIEVEHQDSRRSTLVGHHNDGIFHVSIDTDRRTVDVDIGGPISARILAAALDILTPGGYPRLWSASPSGSVSGRPGKSLDPDTAETLEVIGLLDAAQRSHASRQRITL